MDKLITTITAVASSMLILALLVGGIILSETMNNSPLARILIPHDRILLGETVTLDGSGSFDTDGHIMSFSWTIDGYTIEMNSEAVTTSFEESGSHLIHLEVIDDGGKIGVVDESIWVDSRQVSSTEAVADDTGDAETNPLLELMGIVENAPSITLWDLETAYKTTSTPSGFAIEIEDILDETRALGRAIPYGSSVIEETECVLILDNDYSDSILVGVEMLFVVFPDETLLMFQIGSDGALYSEDDYSVILRPTTD